MGTITSRRRKDGSTGYTAQIRLKRDGQLVHSESETFSTKVLAKEWITRREAGLQLQRARGEPLGTRMTWSELIGWYELRERQGEEWGRSKKADLARLKMASLRDRRADSLTRQDFIHYIEGRRAEGAGPATAANDLIWLRTVFKTATAVLGVPTPLHALDEAASFLRGERITAKSRQRQRRLLKAEEQDLITHFTVRDERADIPMVDIMRFALATARRQEEITRLRWEDLNRERGTALLRDVKHPRLKRGNHKVFKLSSAAWEVINGRNGATESPLIFPYNSKSIGAAFTRAVHVLGIQDLRFHDLRHEATSRLFERGYSIQEVAQFTLHESWAT
ncbi:MAG: tyrosine-type recombinase/integrase, partial [Stenotrophomonas sp.]|uniref:tyrosine-type recombinase/integrase n=1 Tax=Stenotrophomonas sp. TaxID=69392 RepID=UPI003D6D5B29